MSESLRQSQVRQRQRYGSVFRISLGLGALVSAYMALTDPVSLPADTRVLLWLLMGVGIAAVAEAIVNDLLPAHLHWRAALRQRHFILTVIAFGYGAQLYVACPGPGCGGLMLYYLGHACLIMLASILDASQRAKEARCVVVCN